MPLAEDGCLDADVLTDHGSCRKISQRDNRMQSI
jgi:hypothetical protein